MHRWEHSTEDTQFSHFRSPSSVFTGPFKLLLFWFMFDFAVKHTEWHVLTSHIHGQTWTSSVTITVTCKLPRVTCVVVEQSRLLRPHLHHGDYMVRLMCSVCGVSCQSVLFLADTSHGYTTCISYSRFQNTRYFIGAEVRTIMPRVLKLGKNLLNPW